MQKALNFICYNSVMKELKDFKDEIHKCSKCGLCQAECPIYKITGNDCSVSRGQFAMLEGVLSGKLKMSKTINRYLDLCLKCGSCKRFCPSGIDTVDVIISAKAEYLRKHPVAKMKSFFQKYLIFGLMPILISFFVRPAKSEKFDKKVLYFGGCGSRFKGDKSVVKILNSIGIEVVNPLFNCCGIPFFSNGDLQGFENSMKNYIGILKKYDIQQVVTTCASCEKSLKDYVKWASDEDKKFLKQISVRNIYEYLRESNTKLILKKPIKMTYHKPCNINNFADIKWVLENTENLEYVEMPDFDKCCGLNGIFKINEYKIFSKLFSAKRDSIKKCGAKNVATSCLGCEVALRSYSLLSYRVKDLIEFLAARL